MNFITPFLQIAQSVKTNRRILLTTCGDEKDSSTLKRGKVRFFLPTIIIILLFLSCSTDHGLEPIRSVIQGKITFIGQWPVAPSEVRLVSANQFPPSDVNDLIIGESLPVNVTEFDYSFYLKPGNYKVVGVAWRTKDSVWDIISICGLYFAGTDSLMPGEVALTTETSIVKDINITVNRSKARIVSGSKITGSINFEGAWPDSIESAIVIASAKDPLSESFSLLDLSFSNSIKKGSTNAAYSITAASGTYRAIGIIFLKTNAGISIDDLYFTQNIGGLVLREFTVAANETVAGPDFNIKIGPITSGIKGTIQFSGVWPAQPAEVRLISATKFPPAFEDLNIGESLPVEGSSYDYTYNLRAGTYKIVGVAWRAENSTWDILSICGIYFAGKDSLAPGEIVIPDDVTKIENINIKVNRSKAHKITNTKIVGAVQFEGTWPSDFTEARVIATTKFSIFPTVLPTLLDLSFSDGIAFGTKTANYTIKAFPGTYAATGVVFFRTGQTLSVNDIFYSIQVGGLDDTKYTVPEDSTVAGPEFKIKF
jgi:hypothetical protein